MKKQITFKPGANSTVDAFQEDKLIGWYYYDDFTQTYYAKSISGEERTIQMSKVAEKLVRLFLCSYENHKQLPPDKAKLNTQLRLNLKTEKL